MENEKAARNYSRSYHEDRGGKREAIEGTGVYQNISIMKFVSCLIYIFSPCLDE